MKKVQKAVGCGAVILLVILSITWTLGSLARLQQHRFCTRCRNRGTLRFGWAAWWPYVYRDAKNKINWSESLWTWPKRWQRPSM